MTKMINSIIVIFVKTLKAQVSGWDAINAPIGFVTIVHKLKKKKIIQLLIMIIYTNAQSNIN